MSNLISSQRLGLNIQRSSIYVLMVFLTLLAVVPIYVMLINSTRTTEEINTGISLLPGANIVDNWDALNRGGFGVFQGFFNSAFIALVTTVLNVYFSAMTAFGLHVYRFKGRNILWMAILVIMMLPPSLSLVGFFQLIFSVNRFMMGEFGIMMHSYIPLILPAIAGAGSVLFIRQYMATISTEALIEAARIDGANEFYVFNKIMLPLLAPALAAQSIFTFVATWNSFLVPTVILSAMDDRWHTLPMIVARLRGDIFRIELGGLYLGIAVSVLPVIVFYSFMSRYIISGLTLGGVKE